MTAALGPGKERQGRMDMDGCIGGGGGVRCSHL